MQQSSQGEYAPKLQKLFLLGGVHAYGSACFFVFGFIYWGLVGSLYLFVSNCVFGFLCILNWLVYRRVGADKLLATSFLILVYTGLLNVAIHLGASESPLIYWGLSVAVAAAFIYGVRGTLAWVAVCLLFFPGVLYLKRTWFADRVIPLSAYQAEVLNFASYTGILLFLGYTFFLFDRKLKQVMGELARSEATAHQANAAKDVFLATLSHELRTPLTAIHTWLHLLKSGRLDAEKTRKGIETIDRCNQTQIRIVGDLLDVSRATAGKLRLSVQSMNPVRVAKEALESLEPQMNENGITVESWFDPALSEITADPERFRQIVWNLVSNAIRFSRKSGKVRLRLERGVPGEMALIVEDEGRGIAPEQLKRIFEPFMQVDNSMVRCHGGLGLGLAIVKSLTELHSGTVSAESQGLDRGARFTVVLPIAGPVCRERNL